jgi:2-hydroxychromene-2-carboxylate isomerase
MTNFAKNSFYFSIKKFAIKLWQYMHASIMNKLLKRQPRVEVYLSISDPYSYLLLQLLPKLADKTDAKFDLYLMYESLQAQHNNKLWRTWALKDANQLAKLYNLPRIKHTPSESALINGQQLWQLKVKTLSNALTIFHQTWQDNFTENYAPSTPVITHQLSNQHRQMKKGHYAAGSLLFAGEWFVGIERLHYLETALAKQNLREDEKLFTKQLLAFKSIKYQTPPPQAIHAYISLTSPYSYISWQEVKKLSEHYQVTLKANIVLPLLMRGHKIPLAKQRYILFDARREALYKKVNVNQYADPIGQGIINSYELFPYVEQQQKTLAYIDALFEAIYVKGKDLANLKHIKNICQALDIDYQTAVIYNQTNDWQQITENHQKTLNMHGFWSAPCFTFSNIACRGQDRLWLIEQAITTNIQKTALTK